MPDYPGKYRLVMLVPPEDEKYRAFMRQMAEKHPGRGGPRQAGELLGGLVEKAARRLLLQSVPLQDERILTWEQRLKNGREGRLYRELDGVWRIDHESYCLFEIKFTYPERMENGAGIAQLRKSQEILEAQPGVRYVLLRLVYISAEKYEVMPDEETAEQLPALQPDDAYTDTGVIWLHPDQIEKAAGELGLELPENWREPEAREGEVYDPEREAWRSFASTEKEEEEGGAMVEALKRAMQQNKK